MKKYLFLIFPLMILGGTGCKSFEILHPGDTEDAGLYPKDYPDKIVVSFNQDVVFEKIDVKPGEKTTEDEVLATTDKQGIVRITEKEIVVKKNTPGIVEQVNGDDMLLNFGQPIGAKEDDPEIIIPVKRISIDPETSNDDTYELSMEPLPFEDIEDAKNITISNTTYKIKEGRKAKVTYKKIRDRQSKRAKGKKPQSGGE